MAIRGVLGILGFGAMGQAIAHGLLAAEAIDAADLLVYDLDKDKSRNAEDLDLTAVQSPVELARRSRVLLLAVKPQDMGEALEAIAPELAPDAFVISIAAGVSIETLQEQLGSERHVARVMPNTPALVGAGAAGIALSETCSPEDADVVTEIFETFGIAERVPEEAMDAVTALSGSGPAYYFAFVESCAKAAAQLGLETDQAGRLAGQTLYGAGVLLHESGEAPSALRERVTSKGGTTAAALDAFRERDLDGIVLAAMTAAAERSKELGH